MTKWETFCGVIIFLQVQGYEVKQTLINQDNKSSILLERNGKFSSSKCMKHINVQYFSIMDRINKGEVLVQYCPTDDMVSDFHTKPLQGKKFFKFHKVIMNK